MSKADKEQKNPDMISEEMMKAAVSEAFQIENEIYDEWLKDVPEHEFSEDYYDKMKKLTGISLNPDMNEEKKQTSRRIPRLKLRYLLIAALLAALTCGTVMAVEPLREKVMQIIERRFSDHTDVTFEQIKGRMEKEKEVPDEFIKVEPAYVPEGYVLESSLEDATQYWYTNAYINGEKKGFFYSQTAVKDYDVSITSDGSKAEIVQINGNEGYLFHDEYGDYTLLYVQDGSVYSLAGTVEPKTLIDIMKKTFE